MLTDDKCIYNEIGLDCYIDPNAMRMVLKDAGYVKKKQKEMKCNWLRMGRRLYTLYKCTR